MGLCRCSVGNYSLTSGDLPCQLELLSHTCGWWALTQCCFNDGPHFQRSGDVETVLFQCITFITFWILDQTSSNLQGSRRNGCKWCVQNYMWSGWELTSESTSKWITFKNIQSIFTLSSLITFEVLNQTLPNLQGNCRNTRWWFLQNYMENGWELTSELTSKWITFKNIQSIFTLSSSITFEVLNQTLPNLQGNCRNTRWWFLQNYMENGWELTSELTSKWITFKNIQSIFTLSSSITFEVLNQTLPNLQGNCRNTRWWFLQNYMENGWELTSESTSKWITFEIPNHISH